MSGSLRDDLRLAIDLDARVGDDGVDPPLDTGRSGGGVAVGTTVREMEKQLILKTLESCDGNRTNAADTLGISSRTLRNKLHEYGMSGIFKKGGNGVATAEGDDEDE